MVGGTERPYKAPCCIDKSRGIEGDMSGSEWVRQSEPQVEVCDLVQSFRRGSVDAHGALAEKAVIVDRAASAPPNA
jgi:hypothetical protein